MFKIGIYQDFQQGVVLGTFTCIKLYLVPPDFKGYCIRYTLNVQILIQNTSCK